MSALNTAAEKDLRPVRSVPIFTNVSVTERIWLFTATIAAAAGLGVDYVLPAAGLDAPFSIPLVGMIVLIYVAELAVVHLEYGRHAHSFSMSEFALILGLFFATPDDLILATIIGNAAVLAFHRRQTLIKLVFNVAQFTLQAVVALLAFQMYVSLGDPTGPFGWAGAVLAVLAALLVSDLAINTVIRIAGGKVTIHEQLDALGVTALGALLNTAMALVAVLILWLKPAAALLAFVPPVALYMAYRAYMTQREQQAQVRMLYEATKQLHGTPRLELALVAAATSLKSMLNAERAEVIVIEPDSEFVRVTASGPGDELVVMQRTAPGDVESDWRSALTAGRATHIGSSNPSDAVAAPLIGPEGQDLGVVVVENRLGDVAGFDESDLATITTFAAQIAGTIFNNRLVQSLAAANALAQEREALIRAKDDFLASVSHELRTPLTSVLGLSHELASPETQMPAEECAELMAMIAEQSAELSNLVDDLLVSARSDIGTLYMTNAPVRVSEEVDRVLREGNRSSEIEMSGCDIHAWGDALRFRQIVRNLLSNAARYGGDDVRVEIVDLGDTVAIRVHDNGTGVPVEMEATIFEPYGRAHDPGSQPASIGLGLHVARRLAERMGGDLIYRRVGDITTFELTLRKAQVPLGRIPTAL